MNKKYVYQDKWVKIRIDDFDDKGAKGKYTVLERKNAIVIIPLTSSNKTVLLNEFRHPVNEICIGLPMGFVDDNENPDAAAVRELKEETNLEANVKQIGYFHPAPGLTAQKVFVYVCEVEEESLNNLSVEKSGDDIRDLMVVGVNKVEEMIKESKITDGFTLSAFAILKVYLSTPNVLFILL